MTVESREPQDTQYAQKKYTGQSDLLSNGGIQAPDHRSWKAEDQDVSQ